MHELVSKYQNDKEEDEKLEKEVSSTKCSIHNKSTEMFCQKCQKVVCQNCIFGQSHSSHKIVPFTEAEFEKSKKRLPEVVKSLQVHQKTLEKRLENVKEFSMKELEDIKARSERVYSRQFIYQLVEDVLEETKVIVLKEFLDLKNKVKKSNLIHQKAVKELNELVNVLNLEKLAKSGDRLSMERIMTFEAKINEENKPEKNEKLKQLFNEQLYVNEKDIDLHFRKNLVRILTEMIHDKLLSDQE